MAIASAPIVSSIVFDQPSYNPGDKITVTVNYTPGTSGVVQELTGTATDSATSKTGQLTVTFSVLANDTTSLVLTDTGSRAWTMVTNSGTVAVFTATA